MGLGDNCIQNFIYIEVSICFGCSKAIIYRHVYFISDDLENEETVIVSRKFNDFVVRPILKVTVPYNVKIVQATENHAFLS